MAKAFLSHSSAQKEIVTGIANKLGLDNCVIDKFHFEPGEPTLEEIFKHIDESDLFVMFLSEEALASEWVKRELEYATSIRKPEIKKRLQIFVIDRRIDHTNIGIPAWLKEQFNLSPITDEIILYKKINSKLRDIAIDNYPHIRIKEEIFVGRNPLMEEFESKYYTLDNVKPTCIIASGFEEVGRKKFLRNALHKAEKLNKFHDPISITLDSRDSIENFIINLEDLNSRTASDIIEKIGNLELGAKINYAQELLLSFKRQNELLFIVDRGCIIQPNKHVAPWFDEVLNNAEFENITVVCIISTIRPVNHAIRQKVKYLTIHVNELSSTDTRILFVRYCNEVFKFRPEAEIGEEILSLLNGMPAQVYYAAEVVSELGPALVKKRFDEIRKYNDIRVYNVIEQIKNHGDLFYDLLVFISKIEFISYSVIYKVYGRTTEVEDALNKLFVFGVYDHVGLDKEYIQTHYAISDYVNRSKFRVSDKTKKRLKEELASFVKNGSEYPDISQVILTIKSLVEDGRDLPEKLLIPSFVLRSIIDSYYANKYDRVQDLANKILTRPNNYDNSIIREIRYWLCLALARKYRQNNKLNQDVFFDNLKLIEGADYYFLLGFYYRLQGKMPEAEKNFWLALELDSHSQKAKRELVNVLLSQNKFPDALTIAKQNYERKRLNAFHIQAYFICLTRKTKLTSEDKLVIEDLMKSIKISHDFKADEILQCMEAEYKYYIGGNISESIELLKKAINTATFKSYPRRALLEIYRRRGFRDAEQELYSQIQASRDENTLID